MLTIENAQRELKLAVQLNSGPWEQHSISVANNARLIAAHVPHMDCEKAYVMGLMHDIGRRAGVTGIRHIFDGYDYMMSIGEPEIARICLTHSFPIKDVRTFFGKYDCTQEQLDFLRDFLSGNEFDDYDILIQLCDAISLPGGHASWKSGLSTSRCATVCRISPLKSGKRLCGQRRILIICAAAMCMICCRMCLRILL